MDRRQIENLMRDPAAFRDVLLIDADGGPRRLGDVMDPWQREDFLAMDRAWMRIVGRVEVDPPLYRRAYLERPRGHSKTGDIAVSALWAMFAAMRPIVGSCCAGDRDQAKLLRAAIDRLIRINDWLGHFIDIRSDRVINKRNGAELQILSSEAATTYGRTDHFVICDELSHWTNQELWNAVVSGIAKRPNALMLVISNAGIGEGESWNWHAREACRETDGWYFRRLPGPLASWITPAQLAEQRRMLPAPVFRRLWQNEWTSGVTGDALNPQLIAAATNMAAPIPPGVSGVVYLAGLDVGVRRDFSGLVIIGVDPAVGRIWLAGVESWAPRDFADGQVDLHEIESALLHAQRRYGLHSVFSDSHQTEFLKQRLRGRVSIIILPRSSAMLDREARALLTVFQEQRLSLYAEPSLSADLARLRLRETTVGTVRLEASRTIGHGHADCAFALAAALPAALCMREILDAGRSSYSETVLVA